MLSTTPGNGLKNLKNHHVCETPTDDLAAPLHTASHRWASLPRPLLRVPLATPVHAGLTLRLSPISYLSHLIFFSLPLLIERKFVLWKPYKRFARLSLAKANLTNADL